jgi:hypothetical protein
MNRPTNITIAAILFLLLGVWAGYQIVMGLLVSRINFNFNILMIPVGIGLFLGHSWSRGGAKFWIVVYAFACTALLLLYPFLGESSKVEVFGRTLHGTSKHVVAIGFAVLVLIISRWMWKALSSSEALLFFDNPRRKTAEQDAP